MNSVFNLLRSPYSKRIIIEPDYALWMFQADKCTEFSLINHSDMYQKINGILKLFSSSGSHLYISSRSFSYDKTNMLLKNLYPAIEWKDKVVDWELNKILQIEQLIGNDKQFMLFDHSPDVLLGVKHQFKDKCKVFLSSELSQSMFEEYD